MFVKNVILINNELNIKVKWKLAIYVFSNIIYFLA